MGGESDIRGYDIRSISPVTFIPEATAQPVSYHDPTSGGAVRSFTVPVLTYVATLPGGDLQGFGNLEYRIPIAGPVTMGFLWMVERTAFSAAMRCSSTPPAIRV